MAIYIYKLGVVVIKFGLKRVHILAQPLLIIPWMKVSINASKDGEVSPKNDSKSPLSNKTHEREMSESNEDKEINGDRSDHVNGPMKSLNNIFIE